MLTPRHALDSWPRDSPRVSTDTMSEVFNLLDEQLDLRHSFPNVDEECQYRLRGMVPLQSPPSCLSRAMFSPRAYVSYFPDLFLRLPLHGLLLQPEEAGVDDIRRRICHGTLMPFLLYDTKPRS